MSEPFIIQPSYCIESGDINAVGELLGFDWNDVCDAVSEEGIYGQDGSGSYSVSRGERYDNEMINAIFAKMFEDNPHVKTIRIIDDF